jgi:hypothetical protein
MRSTHLLGLTFFLSGVLRITAFISLQLKVEGIRKKVQVSVPNETPDPVATSRGDSSPDVLLPFLPAADPKWACCGPVGEESFVLCRTGGPTKSELSNENILKIVTIQCTDLEVNTLVWKCLGYRINSEKAEWSASECFPNWRDKYPSPPDLIGMQRM